MQIDYIRYRRKVPIKHQKVVMIRELRERL